MDYEIVNPICILCGEEIEKPSQTILSANGAEHKDCGSVFYDDWFGDFLVNWQLWKIRHPNFHINNG